MAQTYLNDNKNMPYPFYGFGALPFSMACVVGLGLCVRGDEPAAAGPVVTCSVSIAEDSVNVAIGRRLADNKFELIGTIYANIAGYCVYVPASVYATYGDGTSIIEILEKVLAQWAGEHMYTPTAGGGTHVEIEELPEEPLFDVFYEEAGDTGITITLTGGEQQVEVNPTAAATAMSVFYTTVTSSTNIVLTSAASTGYMVLGTIPAESVGIYNQLYALDPSCITYMRDAVFGKYNAISVNGYQRALGPALSLDADGLVGFDILSDDVIALDSDADGVDLSVTDGANHDLVTSINGTTVTADAAYPNPVLELKGYTTSLGAIIRWEWARWSPNITGSTVGDTLTLELNGTGKFPNCYDEV